MIFENFENMISLLCEVIGLSYCVFKYVVSHKRGYRLLIAFFLANFLSEYYWAIYQLVINSSPDVSEFVAYLGWNIGFFALSLAEFFMRSDKAKRYFNPLVFIPVLVNIPQLVLYCSFGGIINNIYEVLVTTITEIFCLQEILYNHKNKDKRIKYSLFSIFTLAFLVATYGKWTSSCFDYSSELLNPYLYFSVISSVLSIFLVYGAVKFYSPKSKSTGLRNTSELRFQVLMQAVTIIIIILGCAMGFFTATALKNSTSSNRDSKLTIYLFIISFAVILLILIILFVLTKKYNQIMELNKKLEEKHFGKFNFIITIFITLAFMTSTVIYNNRIYYKASVISLYEDGDKATETTATELENYLTVAMTTLRVTADSVDIMVKNNESIDNITEYLIDQTNRQFEQFDENFTGLYAYIDGEYIDGTNWVPEEGYDPKVRDWYTAAVSADGEVTIVSPYVDAQTGSVVTTIAKKISDTEYGDSIGSKNIVCLDVIVNYINELIEGVNIADKGYGMLVNNDGFIISHQDSNLRGQNIVDNYGSELLTSIITTKKGRLSLKLNDVDCTIFTFPVLDQWYALTVIENTELFEDTYLQLTINVIISLATFALISFFYYIGYKNEQIYGKKVEEMNIQVVAALAQAIDAKDNYTNGHSTRVAEYARMIAAEAGYSASDQAEIYMAGLLHDVGKIGVPDEVINKNTKLTEEEFKLIRKHPIIGNSILETIKERPKLSIGARWHHERYDGTGYPDGLVGTEIPDVARIIAVADAYDAMTSKRSYRDMLSRERVIEEIKNGSGTQFDPKFAEVMLKLIEEDTEYLMRENK